MLDFYIYNGSKSISFFLFTNIQWSSTEYTSNPLWSISKSWYKRVEKSIDIEVLGNDMPANPNNVLEELDVEVLTQEKKDYTMDLPESSDSESINSIVLPQRKLFTLKENVPQKKFGQGIGNRESVASKKPKPVFPAALLNISADKTLANKTKEITAEVKGQARNLFGNRLGTKRKNMFANFVVSESEDDISEIQPKLFAFPKKSLPTRRSSANSKGMREPSPTSSYTTDIEMDDWKLLPSSTMVEHQLEPNLTTPGKKSRLSKLSEAKESTVTDSTKQSNKSVSSKNKSKTLTSPKHNQTDKLVKDASKSPENDVPEDTLPKTRNSTRNKSKLDNTKTKNASQAHNNSNAAVDDAEKTVNLKNITRVIHKTANTHISTHNLEENPADEVEMPEEQLEDEEELALTYEDNDEENLNNSDAVVPVDNKTKIIATNKSQSKVIADPDELEKELASIVGEDAGNIIQTETPIQNKSIYMNKKVIEETPDTQEFTEKLIQNEISQKRGKSIDTTKTIENKERAEASDTINQQKLAKLSTDDNMKPQDNVSKLETDKTRVKNVEDKEIDHLNKDTEPEMETNELEMRDQEVEASEQELEVSGHEAEISNQEAEASDQEAEASDQEVEASEQEAEASDQEAEASYQEADESEERTEAEQELDADEEEEHEQSEKDILTSDNEEIQATEDSEAIDQQEQDESANVDDENDEQEEEQDIDDEEQATDNEEEDVNDDEAQNENQEEIDTADNDDEIEEGDEENEEINGSEELEQSEEHTSRLETGPQQSEDANATHDTTGRNRKKRETNSPEAILNAVADEMPSFTAKGRNTSVRKTKSILKDFTIRPSVAPPRESTGFSDGTRNSSAEGSGWDSHRTTRKTLRQTFGRDFTPRKSLRALVMEKSAKRQTAINDANAELKLPQANSTELQDNNHEEMEIDENVDPNESDHEISRRTRQTTLEMYLQKIKKEHIDRKLKIEEQVRNSLKSNPVKLDVLNFKVPSKPTIRRAMKSSLQTAPKVKRLKPSVIPLDDLPSELVEDMKYKPPKRYRPSNASWVTKRLYKFLETKLEPRYDYKARVRAEKLVETLYNFVHEIRRQRVAPAHAIAELKKEMARLDVVKTHFEFYNFFNEYLPTEIKVKVVPDILNNIPMPREGVFSPILV